MEIGQLDQESMGKLSRANSQHRHSNGTTQKSNSTKEPEVLGCNRSQAVGATQKGCPHRHRLPRADRSWGFLSGAEEMAYHVKSQSKS